MITKGHRQLILEVTVPFDDTAYKDILQFITIVYTINVT